MSTISTEAGFSLLDLLIDEDPQSSAERPLSESLREQAVREGKFRSDLYFRLQVIEVQIPPLREHPEDIVLIAHHFLQRFARKARVRVRGFTREALEILQKYRWPGNVRELRNVVERAVILADHDLLRPEDITLLEERVATAADAVGTPK